jgi:hypothetical protein
LIIRDSLSVSLVNCYFSRNGAYSSDDQSGAGGAIGSLASSIQCLGCYFGYNDADYRGGAVFLDNTKFECLACLYSNNTAVQVDAFAHCLLE